MTLDEIAQRLEWIQASANQCDHEEAHSKEDDLMFDFIKAVAQSKSGWSRFAQKVLEVKQIKFKRWYA